VVLDWPHEVTQQRRQHPRVDVEVPMHFIVGGALPARSGSMNNLSAGGLAFVTAEQVAVGAELTIAFGLGSGCYFTGIQGAVVRCSPLIDGRYQTAVRFAALHPDTFAQLRDWVEEQAGKAGHAARPE
jgi:hypothetical protein